MNKIREIRSRLGINQTQFALRFGWNHSRLSNYENGVRTPELETCHEIVSEFRKHGEAERFEDVFPPSSEAA